MKRWLIMVVVLALLGWFQACSTASKPEEEGDGSDDPSAQVDPGDPVDTVVVADGINALDEAAETDIDRTSVEAVKSPKTVFKKGQTRFLTADPFFSPGGTNGLDQTTATDGMVRDSAGKSNGDFSAPTSAMPSPTMPGADMAMNEAAGEMAPQDSASPGGVPPAGRVADVEEGDIGPQSFDHVPRLDAVGRDTDNVELRPQHRETRLEMCRQQRFVVGDERLHAATPTGMLMVAVTPAPTLGCGVSSSTCSKASWSRAGSRTMTAIRASCPAASAVCARSFRR